MNLYKVNRAHWKWFWKAFYCFFKHCPLTTFLVVVLVAVGRVANFLSMVLPLKVIILAGSSGVPRYFAFFISPDDKANWIGYLAIGTIISYILTRVLDAFSERLASTAGADILGKANELSVISNQEEVAAEFYARFCKVVAWSLFSLAILVLLTFISLDLVVFLLVMVAAQVAFTFWALSGGDDINPGAIKRWVMKPSEGYLNTLKTVNFLGGFFVILWPYLLGGEGNILISIVSFLALRQMLGAVEDMTSMSVRLAKARLRVNALLFREHKLEKQQKRTHVQIGDLFSKEKRDKLVADAILQSGEGYAAGARWQDSPIPSVTTFVIALDPVQGEEKKQRWAQLQVYSSNVANQLVNEERLFEYIPRAKLWAPEVLARFEEANFQCQIVEYGQAKPLGNSWPKWEIELYKHLWSVAPGAQLHQAFTASQLLLHQRLKKSFIDRVDIALDSEHEKKIKEKFVGSLGRLTKLIEGVPLYIYNPMLNAANVVKCDADDRVTITTWGKWKLEPLGVQLPKADREVLKSLIFKVKELRSDCPIYLDVDILLLVNSVKRLEEFINKNKYKKALKEMEHILSKLEEVGRVKPDLLKMA